MKKQIISLCTAIITTNLLGQDSTILEKLETTKQDIIKDIKTERFNNRYLINLIHIDPEVNGYGYHQLANRTELGSVGIMLLPNSWKINLTFTKEIGDNLLFNTQRDDEAKLVEQNPQDYTFIKNESEKDFSWIDFYMKPISKTWGDIGFGFFHLQNSVTIVVDPLYDQPYIKILNIENDSGAYSVTSQNKVYAKYNEKIEKFYITYNIASKNRWFDGFGVSYNYEKSNRIKEINKDIVIDPDTRSNIFSIGFNQTLDEIKTGVRLKTFTLGKVFSKTDYINYDTNKNETYSSTSAELNLELVFIKNWQSNRKIYISGKIISKFDSFSDLGGDTGLDEIKKLELGVIF